MMSRTAVVAVSLCFAVHGRVVLAQHARVLLGQLDHSVKRLDSFLAKNIALPPFTCGDEMWDEGTNATVVATGTWVGEDMFPISTSHLICFRREMECRESTATLTQSSSGSMLTVDDNSYNIDTWTSAEIITKPDQSGCMREILVINRKSKSVTRTRVVAKVDGFCGGLAELGLKSGQTFTEHLDDGSKSVRFQEK